MPFNDTLADPRLAGLDPVKLATVRERLWANYAAETPGFAERYGALAPEQQAKARENFDVSLSKARPDVFRVQIGEKKTRKVAGYAPSTSGWPTVTMTEVDETRYRPLLDPRSEAFLKLVNDRQFDSNTLDDARFEELLPTMRGLLTEDAFDSFAGPYRERLAKRGVTAGWGTVKSAIRGAVPGFVERAIDTLPDAEDEVYRKWRIAYADTDQSMRSAGAVGALAGSGATLGRAIDALAMRAGPRVAAQLITAGALDWSYADRLPGFSAELFDDPALKKVATGVEGAALAALPMGLFRALRGPQGREIVKAALEVPDAIAEARSGLKTAVEAGDAATVNAARKKLAEAHKARMADEAVPTSVPTQGKPPKAAGDVRRLFGSMLTPISTVLENIAPQLKAKLREFEFNLHSRNQAYRQRVTPFVDGIRRRLTRAEQAEFDLAAKQGDSGVVDKFVAKANLVDQYKEFRAALNDMRRDGQSVGFEVGYLPDFFPRKIKNVPAFMEDLYVDGKNAGRWGEVDRALREEEKRLGVAVLDQETQAAVADRVLRGYGADKVVGAAPGVFKERQLIKIPEHLLKHYQPWHEAVGDYVSAVVNSTEKKRFFGAHNRAANPSPFAGEVADAGIKESIGGMVSSLVWQGAIHPSQQAVVGEILRARMIQKPGPGFLQSLRNLTYIDSLGSVASAIAQLPDLVVSGWKNGYIRTGKAALTRKAVRLEDIGISDVGAEFGSRRHLGRAVDRVMSWTLMKRFDRFTKESFINAARSKAQSAAQAKGSQAFKELGKKLAVQFGADAPTVMDDLANGRLNHNTKLHLFNELADFQPIALSEVPKAYLAHPQWRLFYALKSFTIRQVDVIRREAFREIARGNVKRGLLNLGTLGTTLALGQAGVNEIRDILFNRTTDLSDRTVDSLLQVVGLNRYLNYEFQRTKDPVKTVATAVLPPSGAARAASQDVADIIDGKFDLARANVWSSVPVVGRFYHWWLGAGAENSEKQGKTRF